MQKTLKRLNFWYYLIYVAAIIFALIGYQLFRSGIRIDEMSQAGIAISSTLIILIIGSVPITLAIFNKKTKQWALIADVREKLAIYEKWSIIRILIIGSGFVLGVLFFFILNSQSMIFSAGIAAIGLFFSKPAEVKIISDLQIEDPDNY
jgi:hypothetical protein